ncbi:hypothetical protein COV58_04115, partial [Candidatus Roizmanbacteria bacterium CG11_big_fil_rev_8_21_14_0_20_36_8]
FMGLYSIVLLVLTTLFAEIVQKQLELQSTTSVETDHTYILSRLNYDFNRADSVIIPDVIGDVSEQLTLVIEGIEYTYSVNGTAFELSGNGGTFQLNSPRTEVSDVTFQKIGNLSGSPTIKTKLKLNSKVQESSGIKNIEIDTTFGLKP